MSPEVVVAVSTGIVMVFRLYLFLGWCYICIEYGKNPKRNWPSFLFFTSIIVIASVLVDRDKLTLATAIVAHGITFSLVGAGLFLLSGRICAALSLKRR